MQEVDKAYLALFAALPLPCVFPTACSSATRFPMLDILRILTSRCCRPTTGPKRP